MDKRYLLVIKRNNNDFLPVEWNLTEFYQNENLYTLEGIDAFTSRLTQVELLTELVNKKIVDFNEVFMSFSIIYRQNNKTRELKESPIFKDETQILSEDELIDFIIENIEDKVLLNEIFNILNPKDKDEKILQFKFVIKNIDLFKSRGTTGIRAALSILKDISYEKKRSIIIRISKTIIPKTISKRLNKNNIPPKVD